MSVDLLVYALVATLSPLGFAATLAVLGSGRLGALLFAIGFVAAQLATCVLLTLVDGTVWPARGEATRGRAWAELALGVVLVAAGLVVARRGTGQRDDRSSVLERLRRLGPATALGGGVLLGVGGPKRLVLTALAATAIGESTGNELALALVYTVIATLLVWVPVLAFELLGDRALAWLEGGQAWLARRQRTVASASLVAVGVFAVADSLATLV